MVGTTAATPDQSTAATGDLVFRVCGSSLDGQIVRLQSSKCTIGSGPRCTLRLRGRGVRPLHCLILRGVGRTVIRRWSPDTRLNGRSFAEAPLTPGDRLSIGPIELQVLESDRFRQTPSRAVAGDRDTLLQAEKQALQDSRRELQRRQRQWQTERKETEKRFGERTTGVRISSRARVLQLLPS